MCTFSANSCSLLDMFCSFWPKSSFNSSNMSCYRRISASFSLSYFYSTYSIAEVGGGRDPDLCDIAGNDLFDNVHITFSDLMLSNPVYGVTFVR